MGAVPSPFDCYLVLRGREDARGAHGSPLRERAGDRRRCSREHDAVADGALSRARRPSRPRRRAAGRCATSAAWCRSPLRGGEDAALDVVARTRLFTLAESLGAVESLIEHPARMTHASAAGSPLEVDPALVRLSVGIEAADDLVADLAQALDSGRLAWCDRPARRGTGWGEGPLVMTGSKHVRLAPTTALVAGRRDGGVVALAACTRSADPSSTSTATADSSTSTVHDCSTDDHHRSPRHRRPWHRRPSAPTTAAPATVGTDDRGTDDHDSRTDWLRTVDARRRRGHAATRRISD